jgi:Tfp pilus assembly protein FimT
MGRLIESRDGFSLMELVLVGGMLTILLAIAIPSIGTSNRQRVNTAASEVRDVLQTARLRSVAANRSLQVRFNCPARGQYRIVEAGTWADSGRCDPTLYPYPAPADAAYQTPPKPRYDGPVKMIHPNLTLNAAEPGLVIQFFPDGRAMKVVSGTTQMIASVPITVSADAYQKTISVNGLGKVLTQ